MQLTYIGSDGITYPVVDGTLQDQFPPIPDIPENQEVLRTLRGDKPKRGRPRKDSAQAE